MRQHVMRVSVGVCARIRCKRAFSIAIASALALPATVAAAPLYDAGIVLSGLANPRGLSFGPDGALYVAEAGSGGNGPGIISGSGAEVFYGQSGAVSRWKDGVQTRIASGLPSVALANGAEAAGPQDLGFDAAGGLHLAIGLGADPGLRASVLSGQPGAGLLATLVRLDGGTPALVADLGTFEALNNPDGGLPDTNPFKLAAFGNGWLVTDAGANALLGVSAGGAISVQGVLPAQPNPTPIGPPFYQAVPTGLAVGPGGNALVSQLTGFPFLEGAASIFRLDAGNLVPIAGGLTNIVDLAFGPDGSLFALSIDNDGLATPGGSGALYRINDDRSKTLLYDGLVAPTGFAIGKRGDFYISTNSLSPTDGTVIHLAPVPLPATLPALLGIIALLAGLDPRLRAKARRVVQRMALA